MKRQHSLRISWYLLVLLLLSSPSFSQLSIKMGIKGGQNFATFRGDLLPDQLGLSSVDLKSKTGFVAGGFMKVTVLGTFSVQPELLYTQKGVAYDGTISAGNVSRDVEGQLNVSYVELPILGRFEMSLLPTVSLNVYGGPAFSMKVSEGLELEENGVEVPANLSSSDVFEDRDSGFVIGAGLALSPAGLALLFIDARYTIGTDAIFVGEDTALELPDIKNNVFTLSAGIGF